MRTLAANIQVLRSKDGFERDVLILMIVTFFSMQVSDNECADEHDDCSDAKKA